MVVDAVGGGTWRVPRIVWLAGAIMLLAAFCAWMLIPRHYVADDRPKVNLESLIPTTFGEWRVDPTQAQMLVDPTVQEKLDSLYTQSLNRVYLNAQGQRVLLSIAYGRNQNTESTAAHRPEFCYAAQGFVVNRLGVSELSLAQHRINVVRLDSHVGERREPISYWVTLNHEASLPGFQRKLDQLRFGLQGLIVDGMLVRVSTIRHLSDPSSLDGEFELQSQFVRAMERAMSPADRSSVFGS
jgi:EpsI family protein